VLNYFEKSPGYSFWWTWKTIIVTYSHSWLTLVLIIITGFVLYLTLRGWKEKPLFLRMAVSLILPIQFVIHLLMGIPFEVRVFVEIAPVILVLASYPRAVARNSKLAFSE
jgi:hypothetical protein